MNLTESNSNTHADILTQHGREVLRIGPVSGSRYMAILRATGADWGLDTRIGTSESARWRIEI